MSEPTLQDTTTEDAEFHVPLERVNYEAGMLLGVDATRTEQSYHRMRVNRHNYWFHGVGTLFGLAVRMDPATSGSPGDNISLRLKVSPGIGVDGLGREVMSFEPYCVNLRDWFDAQLASEEGNLLLQNGLDDTGENIVLLITMRYHACESGLQPVLARKVNASTNAVSFSRAKDSLLLEIIPGQFPEPADKLTRPGQHLNSVDTDNDLTVAEQTYLATLTDDGAALKRLQAEMVYGVAEDVNGLEIEGDPEDLARVLLATVTVPLRIASLPDLDPIINPQNIAVNNLVRPFVNSADQFAWLAAMETTP